MRRLMLLILCLPVFLAGGCEEQSPRHPRAIDLPDKPFYIGAPGKYRPPGVYVDFRQTHGTFLSSNGDMLVALSAACPHDGCGIYYESMANQFKCPCCARRFTDMGLARGSPPGKPLAMRRLHVVFEGSRGDPASNLRVDPRVTYAQEKNEWSYRYSLHLFEEK